MKIESFYDGINRVNKEQDKNICLVDEKTGKNFTYNDIFKLVNKCIGFLLKNGIREGDSFQAILPNSIEMVIFFLAAGKGGFKFTPCSEDSTDKEILTYNKITKSKLVVYSNENDLGNIFANSISKINIKLDAKFHWLNNEYKNYKAIDGNLYIMTSGTTGAPKAIILSMDKLWASTNFFNNNYNNINPNSIFWNYLPMSYLGGLYNLIF